MPARSTEYMEEMRERILMATLRCLEREGLANASLSDVCEEAGISRGALYVHFKSKSEILCAVVDRAAMLASEKYQFNDASALREILISEFEFTSSEKPQVLYAEMELLAAARTDAPLREAIRRSIDARSEQIRVGMRSLAARRQLRDGVTAEGATRVVTCFIEGMMTQAFGTQGGTALHQESMLALLSGILTPKTLRALTTTQ